MNPIEELRKKRFQFLHELYMKTGANCDYVIHIHELSKELNFSDDDTDKATQYLQGEYLMKYLTFSGVSITHEGVLEIEDALSDSLIDTSALSYD